jgi:hypothetical protein
MASLHQHQMSKLSLSMKMMGRQSPSASLTTSFIVLDISIFNSLYLFQAVGNMIKEVRDAKIVHAYATINMAMYQFPP